MSLWGNDQEGLNRIQIHKDEKNRIDDPSNGILRRKRPMWNMSTMVIEKQWKGRMDAMHLNSIESTIPAIVRYIFRLLWFYYVSLLT